MQAGQPPTGYVPPAGYGQPPSQGPPQGYGPPPQGYAPGPRPAGPPNPAQNAAIALLVCAGLLFIALVTKGWASASEGRTDINAGLFGFEGCGGSECRSLDWDDGAKRLDIEDDVGVFRILGLLAGFAALAGLGAAGGLAISRNTHKVPVKLIQIAVGAASGSLTYFAIRLAMSDRDVNFGPSYSAFLGIGALIGGGIVLQRMLRPLVLQAQAAQPMMATPGAYGAVMQAPPPGGYQPPPGAVMQGPPAGGYQPPPGAVMQAPPPGGYQPPPGAVMQGPPPGGPSMPAPPPPLPAAASACPRCGGQLEFVAQYQRSFCRACQQYA